jgi:hypothetical protein
MIQNNMDQDIIRRVVRNDWGKKRLKIFFVHHPVINKKDERRRRGQET